MLITPMRSTPRKRAPKATLASEETGSPDDDGGDDLKFDAGASRRGRRTDAADRQYGGYARACASKEIDEKRHAIDVDALKPRGLAVAADRIDALSERCALEKDFAENEDDHSHDDRDRQAPKDPAPAENGQRRR